MSPALILAILDGAIAIVEKLLPEIQKLAAGGQISAEDQAKVRARVDALRKPEAFTGAEWEQD